MHRVLVTTALGGTIGAFAGLVLATLVNANCDSIVEVADGCTRLHIGWVAFYGLLLGAASGLLYGRVRP